MALAAREREQQLMELVGRTVAGRYHVERLLGAGGMGAVYAGESLATGRKVAVKLIDKDFAASDLARARFGREIRAMSAVESEHIPSVLDAGTTDDGRAFFVMDLLRGEDLGARIAREQRVELRAALVIVAQVLRGLADAHRAGIVHRDLKPDNVFVIERRRGPHALILDFGVSKFQPPSRSTLPLALTARGVVLGTPFYIAPEQARSDDDVDPRADLYSVGAILFECLAGRPPHVGETYERVILSACTTDAPDLRTIAADVPEPVAAFVAKALARDRAARFQSASEMLAALVELAPEARFLVEEGMPSSLPVASRPSAPSRPSGASRPSGPGTSRSSGAHARVATKPPSRLGSAAVALLAGLGAAIVGAGVTWLVVTRGAAPPPQASPVGAGSAPSAVVAPAASAPVPSASAQEPPPASASVSARAVAPPPPSGGLDLQRTFP